MPFCLSFLAFCVLLRLFVPLFIPVSLLNASVVHESFLFKISQIQREIEYLFVYFSFYDVYPFESKASGVFFSA